MMARQKIFPLLTKLIHWPNYTAILLSTTLIACGGESSKGDIEQAEDSNTQQPSNPVTEQPNLPDDQESSIDHTVLLKENQALTAPRTSLSTDLDDPAYVLQLQSNGFPNVINSITTNNGSVITEDIKIEELFVLFINPVTGEVEIKVNKNFDFEQSSSTYLLNISLGTENIKVLVKLFDVQDGSEAEALKISSYNELESFFKGQFISENIGNDIIMLTNPNSNSHNADNLFVQLDRDIDASNSSVTPWEGYEFHGQLDGNSYVIKNLTLASGKSFIDNPNRFKLSKVKHIGFVNTQLSATLIRSSAFGSVLDHVSLSGKVTSSSDTTFHFAPFRVAGEFKKVYTNLYYDLTNIAPSNGRVEVSALVGTASAPINFGSGYANGSIHMNESAKINAKIHGFADGFADLSDFGYSLLKDSLFYSAIDFEVSNNQEMYGNRAYIQAGGLSNSYLDYPPLTSEDSAYNWRFITDRNSTGRLQSAGNAHRDINNSGQSSDTGQGPDLTFAGITSSAAKNANTFTGLWKENNVFDITQGEYPVLKGMPYPRTEGAEWMKEEHQTDPGIAYQRATFNDHLTAP